MALTDTFREIAIKMSKKQPEMVDQVLEESPIISMIPVQPSSAGTSNVYEEINSVTGAGLVDLNDELPEVAMDSVLKQIDLSVLGGQMFVPEDKAKALGGAAAYFASKQPAILRKTGMDAEQSVLYNNLRAFAIANGGEHKVNAGGSGSTNFSIIAVKWVPGEVTGLYDPTGFGRGLLMDIQPISGGQLYEKSFTFGDGRTKKVLGYGIRLKSYFGIQLANARYVSTIANVDLANGKIPTEMQLDDLVTSVRGQVGGSTWLYMHPRVLSAIQKYKGASLRTEVNVMNMNRQFNAWNDIPILTSYNFKNGDEAAVSFA